MEHLDSALGSLPAGTALCSISPLGLHRNSGVHELLVTRMCLGRPPLLIRVPTQVVCFLTFLKKPAVHIIWTERLCPRQGGVLAGHEAALQQQLAANEASMRGSGAVETPDQKVAWWRERIALDAQLAGLVARLQTELLGPWG